MSQQKSGTFDTAAIDLSVFGLTTEEAHSLLQRCTEAKERAYCPYSNFQVGCSLLVNSSSPAIATTGPYITGANVENAAYPSGSCAEAVTLGTAIAAGHRYGAFKALAVATNTEPGNPASPCGKCRQIIREFCELSLPIFMLDRDGGVIVRTLDELLPMSFGPTSLPKSAPLAAS